MMLFTYIFSFICGFQLISGFAHASPVALPKSITCRVIPREPGNLQMKSVSVTLKKTNNSNDGTFSLAPSERQIFESTDSNIEVDIEGFLAVYPQTSTQGLQISSFMDISIKDNLHKTYANSDFGKSNRDTLNPRAANLVMSANMPNGQMGAAVDCFYNY